MLPPQAHRVSGVLGGRSLHHDSQEDPESPDCIDACCSSTTAAGSHHGLWGLARSSAQILHAQMPVVAAAAAAQAQPRVIVLAAPPMASTGASGGCARAALAASNEHATQAAQAALTAASAAAQAALSAAASATAAATAAVNAAGVLASAVQTQLLRQGESSNLCQSQHHASHGGPRHICDSVSSVYSRAGLKALPFSSSSAKLQRLDSAQQQQREEQVTFAGMYVCGGGAANAVQAMLETTSSLESEEATTSCESVVQCWVCSMYLLPSHLTFDHASPAALVQANKLLGGSALPGMEPRSFVPVLDTSLLFHLGTAWGFTALSITLGSSYFQRLCATEPSVGYWAKRHPNFTDYLNDNARMELGDNESRAYINSMDYQQRELTLKSLLFTCVFIAAKVADRLSHSSLLVYMLSKIYGSRITYQHAYEVEAKCLRGLSWRLGPFYRSDHLEETWETLVVEGP